MAQEQLNRRDEFIARVTRPGQSAAMTDVAKFDDQTFERLLKALAQLPEGE